MRSSMLVLGMMLVAGSACSHTVKASVNCEVVTGPEIECTAQETQGTDDVEVCWDFKVACDSGATLVAPHTCVHVADGKSTKTTIAGDKLTITGNCTGEKHASMGALTLNGKPATP